MWKGLLILLALGSSINTATAHVDPDGTIDIPNKVTFSLFVDNAANLLRVEAVAQTTGYIGLGISPQAPDGENAMIGADILAAGVDANGQCYIKDYKGGSAAGSPTEDPADPGAEPHVDVISCSETDGVTTIVFTRLLVSGDKDNDIDIKAGPINFIWAMGPRKDDGNIEYHTDRGKVTLTLWEDVSTDLPTPTSNDGNTTPPTSDDGNTTPPTSDDGNTTPPTSDDGNTTPPTSDDGNTTPPTSDDGNTTPPTSDDGNTTPPTPTSDPGGPDPDGTIDIPNKVTFSLFVDSAANLLRVEAVAQTTGYIGLGISPQAPDGPNAMIGADILAAGVDANGQCYIKDYKGGSAPGTPTEDPADPGAEPHVDVISCSATNGVTTIVFTRLLVSSDKDNDIDVKAGPINFIWAMGPRKDDGNIEPHTDRGKVTLTLWDDGSTDSPTPPPGGGGGGGGSTLSSWFTFPILLIIACVRSI